MSDRGPAIRHVSDTARWAAFFRAQESDRPDAVFRDPLAKTLAGKTGEEIHAALAFHKRHAWSWVARTYAMDAIIGAEIAAGVRLVVNLAAGLDTRPYRMPIPGETRWIEIDLPAILDEKESMLSGEKPRCTLERVRLDLADTEQRRALFAQLAAARVPSLVITEGLLVYLSEDQVAALARDLASRFDSWAFDVMSPGLLAMIQKETHPQFGDEVTPLKFAPRHGPKFFESCGWHIVETRSMLKTGARIGRLPFLMRLFAMLPEGDPSRMGSRPWSAVCLARRADSVIPRTSSTAEAARSAPDR